MRYESIADIYSANRRFRDELTALLSDINPEEATVAVDDEGWTIAEVAEHIGMVESGVARICARLLAAAKRDNASSDGRFVISEKFGESTAELATARLEAPDVVKPSGGVTLHEAAERLAASTRAIEEFRTDMERYDLTGHTFPHPYFGDLTAAEWLLIAGQHERRHTQQMQRILKKIRQ